MASRWICFLCFTAAVHKLVKYFFLLRLQFLTTCLVGFMCVNITTLQTFETLLLRRVFQTWSEPGKECWVCLSPERLLRVGIECLKGKSLERGMHWKGKPGDQVGSDPKEPLSLIPILSVILTALSLIPQNLQPVMTWVASPLCATPMHSFK